MTDDPDETEGRKLYRGRAEALASSQMNYDRRRVSMSRPDQFPNCMALSSKMEPCLGYSEIRTKLDLEEKENERLRATLKGFLEWHEAGEDLHELILRMTEVKHVLGVDGFVPECDE